MVRGRRVPRTLPDVHVSGTRRQQLSPKLDQL
jgi:hypothetical protein